MGWGGWPDKAGLPPVVSYTANNVVADNLIFDFLQVLGDGGGVYNVGLPGTSFANGQRVTGNVIFNPLAWGWDLKSDDGTAYTTYSGNVLYGSAYDWGGGERDTIHNNGQDFPARHRQLLAAGHRQAEARGRGSEQQHHHLWSRRRAAIDPDNAEIEPSYDSLLDWQPAGSAPPAAPTRVTVLYAYTSRAYVTWHSTFIAGSSPLRSYAVIACRLVRTSNPNLCVRGSRHSITISSAKTEAQGYAVVHHLATGRNFSGSRSRP